LLLSSNLEGGVCNPVINTFLKILSKKILPRVKILEDVKNDE